MKREALKVSQLSVPSRNWPVLTDHPNLELSDLSVRATNVS